MERFPPLSREASHLQLASALLRTMRPHQWAKNALLFAPLFFALKLFEPAALLSATAAFGIFCLLAGSIYLLNDLVDVQQDRAHPQKSKRPIASGQLPQKLAWKMWPLLALTPLVLAACFSWSFLLCALGYFALNLLYSFRLKHVPYLDVMSIAGGFLLRVWGGALVIGVAISGWLLLCTFLLATFLALGKRSHELRVCEGKNTRAVLQHYRLKPLDLSLGVLASLVVMAYCGYTIAPETFEKMGTRQLFYTVPFVVFGLFRFIQLVGGDEHMESPTQELLKDAPSLLNVVLWVVAVGTLLYQGLGI